MIPKKAGFGVMAVILQILSDGYRVNQTITKIMKTVPNFLQKVKGGMIMIVPNHFLRFAKEKKVIYVCSSCR